MQKESSNYPKDKALLTIIVPVFNAAETLPVCLESLHEQSYPSVEIVFVDDCSTDNSLHLIENFCSEISRTKNWKTAVIHHEKNEGVAKARNTGLDRASGEYLYFIDADDRIEPNSFDQIMKRIQSEDYDIMGFNWFLTFKKNSRKMAQPKFFSPLDALMLMLKGRMRWNLWLFVVRRSLYEDHQIRFIPGQNMGEDLLVMVKLFLKSRKVGFLDEYVYHYRQSNQNSLTNTYSDKHIREVTTNVLEVESFLRNSIFANETVPVMDDLKLNIKLPLLISEDIQSYKKWLEWFPESNKHVLRNKSLSIRTRVLQWLAFKKQFWAVKLYNVLVIKVVYGIIYR